MERVTAYIVADENERHAEREREGRNESEQNKQIYLKFWWIMHIVVFIFLFGIIMCRFCGRLKREVRARDKRTRQYFYIYQKYEWWWLG